MELPCSKTFHASCDRLTVSTLEALSQMQGFAQLVDIPSYCDKSLSNHTQSIPNVDWFRAPANMQHNCKRTNLPTAFSVKYLKQGRRRNVSSTHAHLPQEPEGRSPVPMSRACEVEDDASCLSLKPERVAWVWAFLMFQLLCTSHLETQWAG
eukprot:4088520-Amphidinium_carterae.2